MSKTCTLFLDNKVIASIESISLNVDFAPATKLSGPFQGQFEYYMNRKGKYYLRNGNKKIIFEGIGADKCMKKMKYGEILIAEYTLK